jgi:hypothetical protein
LLHPPEGAPIDVMDSPSPAGRGQGEGPREPGSTPAVPRARNAEVDTALEAKARRRRTLIKRSPLPDRHAWPMNACRLAIGSPPVHGRIRRDADHPGVLGTYETSSKAHPVPELPCGLGRGEGSGEASRLPRLTVRSGQV